MPQQNTSAGTLGQWAAMMQVVLQTLYAGVTIIGLATLPAPDVQIQDPWFTLMELLILLMIPSLVVLAAALHEWVPPRNRVFSLASLIFMAGLVVVTALVHFPVLTLSRLSPFSAHPEVFAFTWPSVVYAADILAWDVFFPLMALAAAAALPGTGAARIARALLVASAVLAFAGLLGIPLANMQIRNIGIVGYALVYPAALVPLALALRHSATGR
ncbi:MAG: hypothetical protein R3D59_14765 [Paracoccaceae bacterium]